MVHVVDSVRVAIDTADDSAANSVEYRVWNPRAVGWKHSIRQIAPKSVISRRVKLLRCDNKYAFIFSVGDNAGIWNETAQLDEISNLLLLPIMMILPQQQKSSFLFVRLMWEIL